jgi:hypothetical protein
MPDQVDFLGGTSLDHALPEISTRHCPKELAFAPKVAKAARRPDMGMEGK